MRILITGGAGFIGRNLSRRLVREGHDIVIVDREPSSWNTNTKNVDISSPDDLDPFMNGVDMVYHMASNSNVRNPAADEKDTFGTTVAVLESMERNSVRKLTFTSSSAVYGSKDSKCLETDALDPISEYGKAKARSEIMIEEACGTGAVDATVFRMANVVGPGQSHGVAYDLFHKLLADKGKLAILGNGKQTKEYVHVNDVADAFLSIPEHDGFNVYNVSSGTPLSVLGIADIICEEMRLSDVQYITEESDRGWTGDVPTYSFDTSKLRSTGWSPLFDSEAAIRDSVRHMMNDPPVR